MEPGIALQKVSTGDEQTGLKRYLGPFRALGGEHLNGAMTISAVLAFSTAAVAQVTFLDVSPRPQREQELVTIAPPAPPPLLLRDVLPTDAVNINRRIPFSLAPLPAAQPFKMAGDRESFERAVECLATAVYFEAGAEPLDGQRAVAQVVLNRVRHPAFLPSVCGVVYQWSVGTCQFSFVCDGSLRRVPMRAEWATARAIATAALKGSVFAPVGYATHYHADYVVPYWATSLAKKKVIGRHIFYGWPQWWGTSAAFSNRPTGNESDPRELRAAALTRIANNPTLAMDLQTAGALNPNVTLEALEVIRVLASERTVQAPLNAHQDEVRQFFSRYSDHPAVQTFRRFSAADSRFDTKKFLERLTRYYDPSQPGTVSQNDREVIKAVGGTRKVLEFMSSVRNFAEQTSFGMFMEEPQSPDDGLNTESDIFGGDLSVMTNDISTSEPVHQ